MAPPAREGFQGTLRVGVAFPALSASSDTSLASNYGIQVPVILELGSRVSERVFVGGYGGVAFGGTGSFTSGECDPGATCRAYDFRVGAIVHYHFSPAEAVDPWVGIGLGYEVARVNVANATYSSTSAQVGAEIPILVGLDWRTNDTIAVGPFAAAHFGEYFNYDIAGGPGDSAGSIANKAIHAWFMVGARAVILP